MWDGHQIVQCAGIAYATQPDNVAQDGSGRNSPFTSALLKFMERPGLSLPDLMIEVRKEVLNATNGKQVPWDSSSLTGRFSFKFEGTIAITPEGVAAIDPGDHRQCFIGALIRYIVASTL